MRGNIIKKVLADALKELLLKKDAEEITVNDIVEKVGISRTTFYRHFADKYELINWVYGQYMEELEQKHANITNFRQLIVELLNFFAENRTFFTKVMYYTGQNNFYTYFFFKTSDYIASHIKTALEIENLSANDKVMLSYHSAGMLRIAYEWIDYGCKMDPEQVADILMEITSGQHRAYALPFFSDVEK